MKKRVILLIIFGVLLLNFIYPIYAMNGMPDFDRSTKRIRPDISKFKKLCK